MSGQALEQGRAAFPAQVWSEAFEQLQAAHAESPLDSEDLELLAAVRISDRTRGRQHRHLGAGPSQLASFRCRARAARCAIWTMPDDATSGR